MAVCGDQPNYLVNRMRIKMLESEHMFFALFFFFGQVCMRLDNFF